MKITMARGDLETKTFKVNGPDGKPYTDGFDEIYFSVKKAYTDRDCKFQKRLTDGSIADIGSGEYQFTIQPEDTDGLGFGDYVFDIEVIVENAIKQTFCGDLTLTKEVTHRNNEGE